MPAPRTYTIATILMLLDGMPRSTFDELRRRGAMPWLEEIRPPLGKTKRYRADLVDRYLDNKWNGGRRPAR